MGDVHSVVTGDVVLAAREPSEEQKLRERVARLERLIVGGLEELEEIDKDMQDGAVATVEESAFVDTMFDELEDEMSSYTTACVLDKCVRIFNISYISAAIFLVGTSDGTVDLILNCTALSFMLGVDNLMNEGFAMFTPKGYGKKEEIVFIEHIDEETQLKKMLARPQGRGRPQALRNYTAYGDTFEFNESGPGDGIGIAADANVLSKTVRGCLIGLMVVFTFTDSVLVGSVLTYGEPFWSRVRTALVTFSFEFVIFYLLYIVLHHILILETIMEWNSDRGELKDCYDEHGDDCKFRARGYNGEAPN
ncbi:hypothetical protein JL722_2959 [Aureococcus anophagefferens]|nr:hypothetical protein JL722_2959 [Aureococcus anophagefferens]